jgi:hypothetical protein
MTVRTIVHYPDPRFALPAQPVTVFDGALCAAAAAGAEFFIIDTSGMFDENSIDPASQAFVPPKPPRR